MTLLRLLAFEPGGRRASAAGAPPCARRRAHGAAARRRAVRAAARRGRRRAQRTRLRRRPRTPSPAPHAPRRGAPRRRRRRATRRAAARRIRRRGRRSSPSLQLTRHGARSSPRRPSCKSVEGNALTLALPAAHKHLADKAYADKLKAALEQATGRKLLLAFEVGAAADDVARRAGARERAEAKAQDEAAFRDEPFVRDVARAVRRDRSQPDSIKPVSLSRRRARAR